MTGIEEKARIWAEIDLDALVFNFRQAQKRAGSAKTLAVLKADAYGHGAVQCARALEKAGADYFAVAAPEEGLQLRAAGIRTPVLLLGVAPDCMVRELAENDIELAVNTLETAEHFSRLADGCVVKAHVQLDTGMSRLGLETFKGVEQTGEDVIAISRLPNIRLQGLFTHLCVSDTREEDEYTKNQIRLFKETADYVKAHGVDIPLCHCANSAAIIRFPEAQFDMVREGIMLYGVAPDK
ncbi:MAG TPA: alanine racemase, partial [Candidatus Ventrousia excrementavium]|nr:alanine racemase [Candidatus Ventrousia excrementavium]